MEILVRFLYRWAVPGIRAVFSMDTTSLRGVVYVSIPSANAHDRYFHVDDTPLGASAGETEFILKKKNF